MNIMVIAILLQRTSDNFSTHKNFKFHRLLPRSLIPFHLSLVPDHIQDKVGVVSTSKPAGGENALMKELPKGKAQVQQESQYKWRKGKIWNILRQGDQRDHKTESHRITTTEFHPMKRVGKAEHWECRNKQKVSPKMERQRKNLQEKGKEEYLVKELSEMEASKLSDIEFNRMVIRMIKELTDNYKEQSGK